MKVIVVGGDGFCGWPTSLKLASQGHQVLIVDNLVRRSIDHELSSGSLTDIASIGTRIKTAKNLIGEIDFQHIDISKQPIELRSVIDNFQPDAIVHFGEQRSAPYSMLKDQQRRFTVDNNVLGTHNLCSAIIDIKPDTHLVHLGTMGVYGYTKDFGPIPEGYLDVKINSTATDVDILYPANPGSVYHLSKCLDQLIFQFYVKNWGIKITDLHQGIVWGTQTQLTSLDQNLVNRFDYDGIFGTVLNRFIVQAANNHALSVYGTGGQTRAFINIEDTAHCILLAVENPSKEDRVRIFNQVSEVHSVLSLAELVSAKTGAKIEFLNNPRKELKQNDLAVDNFGLVSLGFDPILLNDTLLAEVLFIADEMKTNFDPRNVNNSPKW